MSDDHNRAMRIHDANTIVRMRQDIAGLRAQLATVIQERDAARGSVEFWRGALVEVREQELASADMLRGFAAGVLANGEPGRALTPTESPPPAEMAAVFVGRCPACNDFPEGPWSSVGEFACQCGAELYASLADGDDGAVHWSFKKAFEDEAAGPTSPTSGTPLVFHKLEVRSDGAEVKSYIDGVEQSAGGTPPHLDNIHMGTCITCGGSGITPRHKRGLIDDGRCGACTGTGLAPTPGTR